ncbi:hypothetical protein ACET3Z_015077 [Daucus carota]
MSIFSLKNIAKATQNLPLIRLRLFLIAVIPYDFSSTDEEEHDGDGVIDREAEDHGDDGDDGVDEVEDVDDDEGDSEAFPDLRHDGEDCFEGGVAVGVDAGDGVDDGGGGEEGEEAEEGEVGEFEEDVDGPVGGGVAVVAVVVEVDSGEEDFGDLDLG